MHSHTVFRAGISASAAFVFGCTPAAQPANTGVPASPPIARLTVAAPGESHLHNIRQITLGGENAEAYFSNDGKWLTLQSTRDGHPCDQQYVMRIDGTGAHRISDGRGKTTCGWFFPGDKRLFFASTSAHDSVCPPKPDPSKGYVWPLDRYDIYTVSRDGSDLKRLTHYDV